MKAGLILRTLGVVPEPSELGLSMLAKSFSVLGTVLRGRVGLVEPVGFREIVDGYVEKRMRVRYEEARTSLINDGLATRRDARVKAFVKGEKTKPAKVFKPRVIMAREPRYNLELATYLKPLEHVLYGNFRGWSKKFYTRTRLIT